MGKRKNKNKKTPPTKLLKEQALFGIKTIDLDTSIQEEDSTECPVVKSYVTAINITTIKQEKRKGIEQQQGAYYYYLRITTFDV